MSPSAFFSELQRLILAQPKRPLVIVNCEECNFCNEVYNSKNLFYCFDTYQSSDCMFIFDSVYSASCYDCDYAVESELCYESVDPFKCFNSEYLEYCGNVRDSSYCYDCGNCSDVFGCVKLNNKSFCIFNRQLSEEEYRREIGRFKALPAQKVLEIVEELKKKFPLTQTVGLNNVNTDYGNYIHFDKDCYLCFDAAHDEDCAYLYDSFHSKNSMDLTYTAQETELAYQAVDSTRLFNCSYVVHGVSCVDSLYLFNCTNVKNSIGCVGLKNKEYCILNRQFSAEDYEKVKETILAQLRVADVGWANLVY